MRLPLSVVALAIAILLLGQKSSLAGIIWLDNSPGGLGQQLDDISLSDLGTPRAGPLPVPGLNPLTVTVLGLGPGAGPTTLNATATSLGINSVGGDVSDRFDSDFNEQLTIAFSHQVEIWQVDFRHFGAGEIFHFGGRSIRNEDLSDGRTDLFRFASPLVVDAFSPLTLAAEVGSIGIEALSLEVAETGSPTNSPPGNVTVPEPASWIVLAGLSVGGLTRRQRLRRIILRPINTLHPRNRGSRIAIHKLPFRGFQLHCENLRATESMIRAIDDFPAFFSLESEDALIIDCGANIGVSVLEWKSRWPMATVIGFEPDPDAFRLLQMNVDRNDIPRVRCIEAAVADFDGRAVLHGERGHGSDARGNSLLPAWGQRQGSSSIEVSCVRLSSYLRDHSVNFLKLDIEGAEESVLREIVDQLDRVQAMYIEVHENRLLDDDNSLQRIVKLVRDAGMKVEQESRFQPHALPPNWSQWGRQVQARQTQLLCFREN